MTEPPSPPPWFLKITAEGGGADEVRELTEAELQRELRHAGAILKRMQVRQGQGSWHPAETVWKKFQKLAAEGIYLRRGERVDGPFTAAKAKQILEAESPAQRKAKIGIHGDWVSAALLLERLRALEAGATSRDVDQRSTDRPKPGKQSAPSAEAAIVTATVVPDEVAGPALELVLVAEPVVQSTAANRPARSRTASPATAATANARPDVRPPTRAPSASHSPSANHSASVRRPNAAAKSGRSHSNVIAWIVVGMIAFAGVCFVGIVVTVIALGLSGRSDDAPSAAAVDASAADREAQQGREMPAPAVASGQLFRPRFETSLGPAEGGTLFAARVGRSNRLVLLGAAHLLGPPTGLSRQLRGSEVLMHYRGLTILDCVSGAIQEVEGEPIRLRTAEFPSPSVHGDAVAIEPHNRLGLDPLPVASQLPAAGERIWLLAPSRSTERLVHSGRWLGVEEEWYYYRLDDQALDIVGTSGGAVLDSQHRVIGIHVAAGESDQGTLSIASPIKPLIPEIQ